MKEKRPPEIADQEITSLERKGMRFQGLVLSSFMGVFFLGQFLPNGS